MVEGREGGLKRREKIIFYWVLTQVRTVLDGKW